MRLEDTNGKKTVRLGGVFPMLYKSNRELLELYNALNNSEYAVEGELTVQTKENVFFLQMKDDRSFLVEYNTGLCDQMIYYSPNIALRGFLRMVDFYRRLVNNTQLYGYQQIKIPAPQYVVLYNGSRMDCPEFVQTLSEAYVNKREGCLDFSVRVININLESDHELLKKCKSLYGYAFLVERVRRHMNRMSIRKVVELAIEEGVHRNILKDFFLEEKQNIINIISEQHSQAYADNPKKEYDRAFYAGETKGANLKLVELICKKLRNGKSVQMIAKEIEEPVEDVRVVCRIAQKYAPVYDTISVYEDLYQRLKNNC